MSLWRSQLWGCAILLSKGDMAKLASQSSMNKLVLWVIFFVVITAFCGLVYGAAQQDFRQTANDPQIQMAEDASVALGAGQKVNPPGSVDVAHSLTPFMIVYNSQGQVVSSNAKLNGQTPVLPSGIFNNVKNNGEERFTWQPQDDVRIAAVVTSYTGGFVLAGRNIREVENREHKLTLQVGGVWVAAVGIVTGLIVLL